MSVLTLVRHGQASFLAANYDELSEVGRTQARRLGEYWARRGASFTATYTGPRVRQRQTAELVGDAFHREGLAWPEPVVLAELDEYDLGGLLERLAPRLVEEHSGFSDLWGRYHETTAVADRARHFQKMFEVLTRHWQETTATDPNLEGWKLFHARVVRGMSRMLEPAGRDRRVVAFTSGGFIGTAVQSSLAAPDLAALELSWRLRNTAMAEFVFSRDRYALDGFNIMPHLPESDLWTYR